MKRTVSVIVLSMLLIGISILTIKIQTLNTVKGQQNGFRTVSSLDDPENPSASAFLDILQVTVETDDFALLRLNMTLRGAPPDSHAFVNKTLDDNLSYAWYIDADRNSSTGQRHQHVGSEYNIMTQASGGSPTGEWGARVDVTGSMPGGGAVEFIIRENTFSLILSLSQIGNANNFDFSVETWGRLNGSSLGHNPETTTHTVDLPEQEQSKDRSILLLVNENLYPMMLPSLSTFEQDLEDEGYRVVNATVSSTTSPPEIKDMIKSFYQSTGNLVGAILVGKIKAAYLEIFTGSTDGSVYKSLDACDMYYMDLDGTWEHVSNPDFGEDKPPNVPNCYKYASCDTFMNEYIVYLEEEEKEWNYSEIVNKNQFKAEIWVSRIMAHNLKIPGKSEAQIINDYFERNHNFRTAGKIANKAYMLAAWQETGPGAYQSMDFSTVFENITKADNVTERGFLDCLQDPEGSKLLFLGAHSGPQSHALYDQSVTTDELIGKNKTSAFYLLNACSSCRWDQDVSSPSNPNYLGGLYVFDTSPNRKNNGLGAIGFTGVGGFNWLNYFSDYLRAHADASFGDAYKHWFNSMLVQFMCCWPPGALNYVYLGDPTIGPEHPISRIHDIGLTSVVPYRTVVGINQTTSISVTVLNGGDFEENFNLTLYCNESIIESKEMMLARKESTTSEFEVSFQQLGKFILKATVETVSNESDKENNIIIFQTVTVCIPSDVNADNEVNILDISLVATAYGSKPNDQRWNCSADVNEDGEINILDISSIAKDFGETV